MARSPYTLVAPLVACVLFACNGSDDKTPTDTTTNDTTDTGHTTVPDDADGDGVPASEDCDDNNPLRFPGSVEHCDGIDNNCVDDLEVDVITVLPDQSFATLAEAAEVVGGGEAIHVCPGTYTGTTHFTVPITLIGIAGDDPTGGEPARPILDGDGGLTTLRLDGAGSTVEGLAITGGTESGILVGLTADVTLIDLDVYDNIGDYGAGIQFSPAGGTLERSIIRDNIAQEDGGGLYANGELHITDVTITGNVAGNWGGGVTLGDSGELTLTDVLITDNAAERGGGLFALENTSVTANGTTTIEGNNASASGGGVYLFDSVWTGGSVSGNSAIDSGGGLYVFDGAAITGLLVDGTDATRGGGLFAEGLVGLDALQVCNNAATSDGRGVYLLDASATLSGTTVDGNAAPDGGGIYLQDSSIVDGLVSGNTAEDGGGIFVSNVEETTVAVLDGTRVEDNEASVSGGGIYLPDDTDLVDAIIVRNLSQDRAGGVYVTNEAEVNIEGSLIQSNTAVQRGGGLYTNTNAIVEAVETELSRNQALRGAGVYLNNDSSLQLTDCTVQENGDPTTVSGGGLFAEGLVGLDALQVCNNTATSDGGGVYLLDASATLSGTTVDGNAAPDGGGIYLQDSSIVDGLVSGNTAEDGGGIFVSNVEETTVAVLDGTRVEDNEASVSGGGIYLPDDTDLVDAIIVRNLSQDRAGGVYVTNEAEVNIEGSLIQSNTAVQRGGGLYTNTNAIVEAVETELSRNQALRGAGVYLNNDSSLQLTDCTVQENGDPTTVSGGGVRVISGDLVSITSDWGDGPFDNTPDDVFTEQFGNYIGYDTNATFACDAYGCSPEP